MMGKLKAAYVKVEALLTRILSATAVYHLLPMRMRIAEFYVILGDARSAYEYIELVKRRDPALEELFQAEAQDGEKSQERVPLTAVLSKLALRRLFSEKLNHLAYSAKAFTGLGRLRIAAAYRSVYLLRRALDAIASGQVQDKSQRHEAILLEIGSNDYCLSIIDKPGAITGPRRDELIKQLEDSAAWSLERKAAVFVDRRADEASKRSSHVRGRTAKLQGPSKRFSNLTEKSTDLLCVVGYAGPQSLVSPVERVDISLYVSHKIVNLHRNNQLDLLKRVGLPLISMRESLDRDVHDRVVAEQGAVHSNVRFSYCYSAINGGVEFFVWLLGARAAKIIVTNFDMFLNKAYPTGYIANRPESFLEREDGEWKLQRQSALLSFCLHDPSQQYSIYKSFHGHSEVEYDSVLGEIISAPFSAYVEALERTYRTPL